MFPVHQTLPHLYADIWREASPAEGELHLFTNYLSSLFKLNGSIKVNEDLARRENAEERHPAAWIHSSINKMMVQGSYKAAWNVSFIKKENANLILKSK